MRPPLLLAALACLSAAATTATAAVAPADKLGDDAVSPPRQPPSALTLVSTVDGHVFAYSADAAMRDSKVAPMWSANLGGSTIKSFQDSSSYDPIGLVIPGTDGSIFVKPPNSNQLERFPFSVPEFIDKGPMHQVLSNGRRLAIVGSTESRVFQVNADTGEVLRTFSSQDGESAPPDSSKSSSPADSATNLDEGELDGSQSAHIILISRNDFRVRAFDEESGLEVWNFTYGVLNTPLQINDDHFAQIAEAWTGSTPVRSVSMRLAAPKQTAEVEISHLVMPDGYVQFYATPQPFSSQSRPLSQQQQPQDQNLLGAGSLALEPLATAGPAGDTKALSTAVHIDTCGGQTDRCLISPGRHRVAQVLELVRPPEMAKLTTSIEARWASSRSMALASFATALLLVGGFWLFRLFVAPLQLPSAANGALDAAAAAAAAAATTIARPSQIVIHHSKVKGVGCNGTIVFEGTFQNRPVAVKRMQSALYDRANKEVDLLIQSEGHQNVVRYLAKEETPDFVYLALELCHMTLDQAVESYRKEPMVVQSKALLPPFCQPGDATRLFLKEIASATDHLHKAGIVHCDIKPQNILVVPRSNNISQLLELGARWIPKLSDMGLSKAIERERSSFRMTSVGGGATSSGGHKGTVGWRAPELLIQSADSRITRKIDVFSLGCLFFYLLESGAHPFGEWLARESNIVDGKAVELFRLAPYSVEAYALIRSMVAAQPDRRPSMGATLKSPFFWNSKTRLDFLCDVSDRLEHASTQEVLALEQRAVEIVGFRNEEPVYDWVSVLDAALQADVALPKHRRYDVHSIKDLLRYIRNRRHHREAVDALLTHDASVFLEHFMGPGKFPGLTVACVSWLEETGMAIEPHFAALLGEHGNRDGITAKCRGWYASDWPAQWASRRLLPMPPPPKTPVWKTVLCEHWKNSMGTSCVVGDECGFAHSPVELRLSPFDMPEISARQSLLRERSDRGWYDQDWTLHESSLDEIEALPPGTKRVLCEHWERSGGTRCVMGGKCGFAHGLVELREGGGASGGGGGGGGAYAKSNGGGGGGGHHNGHNRHHHHANGGASRFKGGGGGGKTASHA